MPHPIVHAEIRSSDPDATRAFFGEMFGWTYPQEGAVPGYTFVDTGVPDALYTAISPLQGDDDLVTFFVGVDDIGDVVGEGDRTGRPRRSGHRHGARGVVRTDRRSAGPHRGSGSAALSVTQPPGTRQRGFPAGCDQLSGLDGEIQPVPAPERLSSRGKPGDPAASDHRGRTASRRPPRR